MEKFLLIMFVGSGAAFVIQTVLGFIGFDELDFDVDTDGGDGVGFFTIRNLISFVLGFSSGSYFSLKNGYPSLIGLLVGFVFGVALVLGTFFMMKAVHKMQQPNLITDEDYVYKQGVVMVEIPASESGIGKVEFTINGRNEEMTAVTDSQESLKKGTPVTVIKRLSNNALLVRIDPE